jgi:hypothetical protein
MNTIRVELSVDQLKQALHKLPTKEKVAIWRMLDTEIDRSAITQRFDTAIKFIRSSYNDFSEETVMADVINATHQVRKTKQAKNRS